MKVKRIAFLVLVSSLVVACQPESEVSSSTPKQAKKDVVIPAFSSDSAYQFIQDQVDFGPRVPNTEAQLACSKYLQEKLESYGAEVIMQEDKVYAYDNSALRMINVIGQFQPEKKRRIMLYAHWDTRPWADKDSVAAMVHTPIDGANDGGSGVGVLLEIARHLGKTQPDHGIDIIFFDTEDYGTPEFAKQDGNYLSWCLGSQYWSENKHKPNYRAKFGILLDMVGSNTATFPKEGTSMHYAPHIVDKVWRSAKKTNNGNFFTDEITGHTIDDHRFVNELGGIPSICIVEYHTNFITMGLSNYGAFHHTHKDNMDVIDKKTLQAVGETVMHTIYTE